jgi:hypothetical protein
MEANELMDKMTSGKMTRREFKKALAAVGLGLFAAPLASRRGLAATEDHPVIFTWEGYEDPGMHGSYLSKHGESPNFTFFGDEEEAFAKMRAGFTPDIVMPCSYKVAIWRDAGIIQPTQERARYGGRREALLGLHGLGPDLDHLSRGYGGHRGGVLGLDVGRTLSRPPVDDGQPDRRRDGGGHLWWRQGPLQHDP